MKLFRSGLILGMLTLIQGVQSLQAVIVTYPRETPDSVIESAKQALVKAVSTLNAPDVLLRLAWLSLTEFLCPRKGGIITHEYRKSFDECSRVL